MNCVSLSLEEKLASSLCSLEGSWEYSANLAHLFVLEE